MGQLYAHDTALITHWTGVWYGPGADLEALKKRKVSAFTGSRIPVPRSSNLEPSHYVLWITKAHACAQRRLYYRSSYWGPVLRPVTQPAWVFLWGTNSQLENSIITGFFGFFPSSGILGNRNTTFRKLDLFPSSGEGGRTQSLDNPCPLIEISSF
jgi:hypothetical protein